MHAGTPTAATAAATVCCCDCCCVGGGCICLAALAAAGLLIPDRDGMHHTVRSSGMEEGEKGGGVGGQMATQ
jgi:hypothetical protein